jgi:hypothetical protein
MKLCVPFPLVNMTIRQVYKTIDFMFLNELVAFETMFPTSNIPLKTISRCLFRYQNS